VGVAVGDGSGTRIIFSNKYINTSANTPNSPNHSHNYYNNHPTSHNHKPFSPKSGGGGGGVGGVGVGEGVGDKASTGKYDEQYYSYLNSQVSTRYNKLVTHL
jgi:hypothetical protein